MPRTLQRPAASCHRAAPDPMAEPASTFPTSSPTTCARVAHQPPTVAPFAQLPATYAQVPAGQCSLGERCFSAAWRAPQRCSTPARRMSRARPPCCAALSCPPLPLHSPRCLRRRLRWRTSGCVGTLTGSETCASALAAGAAGSPGNTAGMLSFSSVAATMAARAPFPLKSLTYQH